MISKALGASLLALGFAWAAEGSEMAHQRVVESPAFILVGSDPETVLYAREVAVRADRLWTHTFGAIRPEAPAVRVDLDTLSAATNARREDLSYLLASAWWRRAALFATGRNEVPEWLILASALRQEAALNPLFRVQLWQEAGYPEGPLSLEKLFAQEAPPGAAARLTACVLLESLGGVRSGRNHGGLASWLALDRASAVADWLREAEDPALFAAGPETWWANAWAAARLAAGPHFTMEESHARVELLGRRRADEPVREQVARIRSELNRVHPLYHNALLSLGRHLEAVAEENFEAALPHLEQYRVDLERARQTAAEIRALLEIE